MDILFTIHSILRWLVIVAAVAAIVQLAMTWLNRRAFTMLDRRILSGYTISMDIQILVGIILLIMYAVNGAFQSYQAEHAVAMLIAVALAHLTAMWRKAEDSIRARNSLFAVIGSLVVVFAGIALIPR